MKRKIIFNTAFLALAIVMFIYAFAPEIQFPPPPAGSVQSMEKADIENPMRRAYFTDFDREQIIRHYQQDFRLSILGLSIPTLRLNYPPEDAQVLIRDQTRSVFLEELVHPLRQSIYINGFSPKEAKDEIWYKGIHYQQKITVRFVPSNRPVRIAVALGIVVAAYLVMRFLGATIIDVVSLLKNKDR